MQFLTSRQSRELDKIAASKFGIPGKILMGNAGNQIANTVLKIYPDTEKYKILIICGKGNNGGDGFAAALSLKKFEPQISMIYSPDTLSDDANHYYLKCIENDIHIQFQEVPPESHEFNLMIDAMLGIGMIGKVRSPIAEWITWVNYQQEDVISALTNLGYPKTAAEHAVQKASRDKTDQMFEELLRKSLQVLAR